MIQHDELNLAHTGADADSLTHYRRALRQFQCFIEDPVGSIDAAIAARPDFVMAHVFKAYLHLIGTEPEAIAPAREFHAAAAALPANGRERGHIEAVSQLLAGNWHRAGRVLEDIAIDNPTDISADAERRHYAAAIDIAVADGSIDAILVVLAPQYMTQPAATVRAIVAHLDETTPVLASFLGGSDVMPSRKELAAAGLPFYDSPERAVGALKAMHEYGVWKRRPARHVVRFPVNRRRVERIITRRQRTGRLRLGEVKSKDILKAYGFHTMEGRLTTTPEEAVEIARFIGFPVAMKIVSPSIVHKSDLGGVRLNIGCPRATLQAALERMAKAGALHGGEG